jgi:hypothetical protein
VKAGDRVEYIGEPFLDEGEWVKPGHKGTVIDLEPPDDSPIVNFDGPVGALVVGPSDVRPIDEPPRPRVSL